jgi:hypothetical protein
VHGSTSQARRFRRRKTRLNTVGNVRDSLLGLLKGSVRRIVGAMPPLVAASLDHARPGNRHAWGGAFNGQQARQRMVEDICRACGFVAVIETGTFRGTTTEFLRRTADVSVYTVESNKRYYYYSRLRFARDRRVRVLLGDSRVFLRSAATDAKIPKRKVFFYLDAHWHVDLPLAEELATIGRNWTDSVVVVDDFRVPDDPGYGFDDYGGRNRLSLHSLPAEALAGFAVFYPAIPSAEETGARRGCLVLATSGQTAHVLAGIESLRVAAW